MECPLYRDSIVVQISNLLLERRNENESGSFYKIIFTFGEEVNEEAATQRRFLKWLCWKNFPKFSGNIGE